MKDEGGENFIFVEVRIKNRYGVQTNMLSRAQVITISDHIMLLFVRTQYVPPTWECFGHSTEQLLNVVARLGAGLDEHDVELLGLSLSLVSRDLPLVGQVRLVSNWERRL